jgi:hypothetical protein
MPTMPTPQRLPRPDFARLLDLGDQVIATLEVAVHDEDQRMLLVGEARDLIDRIQDALVRIEQADPTWAGWAVVEPPKGTMAEREMRRAVQRPASPRRFRQVAGSPRPGPTCVHGRRPRSPA